jgi:hypothetical protein
VRCQESDYWLDAKSSDRWRDARRWKSLVGDQGVDLWCDVEI